ncbi:DHA2 family efflux MFS transporter permease subunit [Rickettsiales bacterium LUAb2]
MSANSTATSSQEAPTYFTGIKLVLLTLAISLTTFMEVLDSTIVNVAIPHISGSLGATTTQGTWTISAYTLASAIVVPLTGWVSNRFGQIKVFMAAIALFTVMSILCGIAENITTLVIFRFLQGFFSGPMVPLAQALLFTNYPPEKRGLALAFFVMTIILAPIFGPVLGGYITDTLNWPWIFYINVPVGIVTVILVFILLRKRESKIIRTPIDYVGLMLLFIGVGCLQVMLDKGNDVDWFNSPYIVALGIIAFIGIGLLIIWELTDKHPVIDLSLFKSRNFTVGMISICLGMFCFFGSTIIFPLWLQTVKGYTSTLSGLATAPIGILPFFLSPLIGAFLPKLNLRILVTFSFLVFSLTMFWFATFNFDIPFANLILPRLIQGIGIACFFLPLNQITLSGISPDKIVTASSLINFFRALSTSFAAAIVTFSWQHLTIRDHALLTEKVNNASVGTNNYLNSLSNQGINNTASYSYISNIIDQQAFTMATNYIFAVMGVIFLLLIAVVWFAKPPFNSGKGGGGH